MTNQTWAILFTDKAGESHKLEFEWNEKPSLEEAASRIVRQHQEGQQEPVIIDILRSDQTPKQTQMTFFGYKIIECKLVEDSDAFYDEVPEHPAITQLDVWRDEAFETISKNAKGRLGGGSGDMEVLIQDEVIDAHGPEIKELIAKLEREMSELMARLGPDERIGVATKEDQDRRDALDEALLRLNDYQL